MKQAAPPPVTDANEEINALIEKLQQTEQRLKTLAGGELDSVADASGRTFLLQHAQEQLVLNEVAKQAAILNALPAHVALLDSHGKIIAVNEAWRRYSGRDTLQDPGHGLGLNYLEVCDSAAGDKSAEAPQVAAGIRAVLSGVESSFSIEYPCHSPTEQSWFLLKVMPLPGSPPQGAVVMHVNVTSERQAQEKLRISEKRFRQMAENIRDVFFLIDAKNGQILYISPAYEEIWGLSCESLYADPESWVAAIHPEDRAATHQGFRQGFIAGNFELTYRIVRPDASIRWIEAKAFPVQDSAGKYVRITGICMDVTERRQASLLIKQSEQRLALATESAQIGIWDWNIVADHMVWDAQMFVLYGIREENFSAAYETWQNGLHPEDRARAEAEIAAALSGAKNFDTNFRVVWPSGEVRNIQAHAAVQRANNGAAERMIGVNWDITDEKQAEIRIKYLNRVYAMLSAINMLIVRVKEREELFNEACRIAVQEGGFRMALIGVLDPASNKIVPVASAGMGAVLLSAIKNAYAFKEGAESGNSLIARVLRDEKTVISNDSQHDSEVLFGDELIQARVCSLALLPLIHAGRMLGVLMLYANEINFFHQDEIKLLEELASDIAFGMDHIEKQDQLNYLAYYDALTGLANRSLFQDRLAQNLRARDSDPRLVATVLLDLERFRHVNETLGRNTGDKLLRDIGARLHRVNDSAARISGDMFGLVLRGGRTALSTQEALGSLLATCFSKPFILLGGQELHVTCRAGVALYPDDGTDADMLMRNAEAALRQSKHTHERIEFYATAMNARLADALAIETRLRYAIERKEFVLHYQPKLSLPNGCIIGAEALIRWQDPDHGLVSPGLFIPVLEETGMIVEVGHWVVQQVFVDLCAWAACGVRVPRIAVNVSALQLQRRDFVDGVIAEIHRGGNHPEWLELEITESIVMANVEDSTLKLSILRGRGVTIAIDDFGAGG